MRNGPTAALRSAAKIDGRLVSWNNCVMLQFYRSAFDGNEGAGVLADLLRGYFMLGGQQLQPNTVSVEELRDAREHPERHRDLIIRMWGVSSHFVKMPADVQDEFIARYENS